MNLGRIKTTGSIALIVLLSAAGGAALTTILRTPMPARVPQVGAGISDGEARPATREVHAGALEKSGVAIPRGPGTVAQVRLANPAEQDRLNARLHFCVFENGANDLIYAATKYGMWSSGEFELSIDGIIVFTGKVKHLVYEGTVIDMGDVIAEQPRSNFGIEITRVTGLFK